MPNKTKFNFVNRCVSLEVCECSDSCRCWWALRGCEVATPSSTVPFTTLQGVSFEPLALHSRWTGTENGPLHLAKWQSLTMRTILFDTGQTPKTFCSPVASCWLNTPVQLQRGANKGRTGRDAGLDTDSMRERCTYWFWQAKTRRKQHQVSLVFLWNPADFDCRLLAKHARQWRNTNHTHTHTGDGHATVNTETTGDFQLFCAVHRSSSRSD